MFSDRHLSKQALPIELEPSSWKLGKAQTSKIPIMKDRVFHLLFQSDKTYIKKYFSYCYISGTFTVSCLASLCIIV